MSETPEAWARKFHDVYERLAPQFDYETRAFPRGFNPESANGMLMIAVCAEVLASAREEIEALKAGVVRLTQEREGVRGAPSFIWFELKCRREGCQLLVLEARAARLEAALARERGCGECWAGKSCGADCRMNDIAEARAAPKEGNGTTKEWKNPTPYQAGYDRGLNGMNTANCHFSFFSTRQRSQEWELGKADGERAKLKESSCKT